MTDASKEPGFEVPWSAASHLSEVALSIAQVEELVGLAASSEAIAHPVQLAFDAVVGMLAALREKAEKSQEHFELIARGHLAAKD